jgi:DNA polymerase III delta prime subunit
MSFIYKYRPSTLDEFELETKDTIGYFSHLLLIGGERTGKTTLASILIKDCDMDNVLHINSLKEQGIQYYRNEVKHFCQTTSLVKKTIVIDGLDEMNEQTQQIFLNYIDKYGHNVRFIAIGMNPQKIIESMYSRFMVIKLYPVSILYIKNMIDKVTRNENIQMDEDATEYLIALTNQSIRTILNYLERYKIMNVPITVDYIKLTHTEIHTILFKNFTDLILLKKKEAVTILMQMYSDGYSVMDILDSYYTYIKSATITEEYKYKLIKIICKYTVIFNNIHEHHVELLFFVQDCINISNGSHTLRTLQT